MNELLTPCIVQTVIICCTIIIIALVGLSGYRIKNNLNNLGMDMCLLPAS